MAIQFCFDQDGPIDVQAAACCRANQRVSITTVSTHPSLGWDDAWGITPSSNCGPDHTWVPWGGHHNEFNQGWANCCIPNDIVSIEYHSAEYFYNTGGSDCSGNSATCNNGHTGEWRAESNDSYWTTDFLCGGAAHDSWDVQYSNCYNDLGEQWLDLEYIDFGNNKFSIDGIDARNFYCNTSTVANSNNDKSVFGCSGFKTNAITFGGGQLDCDCEYGPNECGGDGLDSTGSQCIEGMSCDQADVGNDSYWCESDNKTGGSVDENAIYCSVVDNCGVCGGNGLDGITANGANCTDGGSACDCQGNCLDDCNICAGDANYMEVTIQGLGNYPRYTFDSIGGGSIQYCDCELTLPTEQLCYQEGNIAGIGLPFTLCAGESCPDGFTMDVPQDPGCLDITACNYNDNYETDCSDNAIPNELGEYGDTSCCVYPATYCIADGSLYEGYNPPQGAILNGLCDVDVDGQVSTVDYCPRCDVYDNPVDACGSGGYSLIQFNENNLIQEGGLGKIPEYELITYEDNPGSYTYAWLIGQYNENMTDQSEYSLTGTCLDPGAYNTSTDGLYFDQNFDITSFSPVEACQYCPDRPDLCPSGYQFYWNDHYNPMGVITNAVVTDTNWSSGTQSPVFNLPLPSNQMSAAGPYGACFCIDDLNFLDSLADLKLNYNDDSLFLTNENPNSNSTWNSEGRLVRLTLSGLDLTGNLDGDAFNLLTKLEHLDLSNNSLSGEIPINIQNLESLNTLDLSNNDLSVLNPTTHTIEAGQYYYGICALVNNNGAPTSNPSEDWLQLDDNNICPGILNPGSDTTAYPNCLCPNVGTLEWEGMSIQRQEWIWDNLGFIDLPSPSYSGYNSDAQDIETNGILDCPVTGCGQPDALNYWPAVETNGPNDCGASCCQYDNFLHFPWSDLPYYANEEPGYGVGMSNYEMVQALHANIYGFSYNSFGDLDVTNEPTTYNGNCQGASDYYLPQSVINQCQMAFANQTIDGSTYIDHFDGIWIRDFGNYSEPIPVAWGDYQVGHIFDGDSRPLEFINRIEKQAFFQNNPSAHKSIWFGQYFGDNTDISMQGIVYEQDYDCNEDGVFNMGDEPCWRQLKGRHDIADQIYLGEWVDWPYPEEAPEDFELWEESPPMVSMSYSQKFVSEIDAGFTLKPEENSPGIYTRSGQWFCQDGGPSDACYEFDDACGKVPDWWEDCTPCGLETSADADRVCIPMTVDTAAEGYDKISRTKFKQINYFSNSGSLSEMYGGDIYTASLSSSNHPYYYAVINNEPTSPKANTQFYVSFGHIKGSGSKVDLDVSGSGNIGSSEGVYKQYASMLIDDNDIETGFLISSGSDVTDSETDGNPDEWIYVLNFKRKKYQDSLQAGNWTLQLSGSHGNIGKTIRLTDNSKVLTSPPKVSIANSQGDIARRFDIISGSNGVPHSDYTVNGGRYGWFYPDAGMMVFGEKLSHEMKSGSQGNGDTNSPGVAEFNILRVGGHDQLYPNTGSSADGKNALRFINCMKNVSNTSGSAISLYGEKEVTQVIYVCRLNGTDFNFTNNFSVITGSGRTMFNTDDTAVMNGFPTSTHESRCFTGSAGQPSSVCSGSDEIETKTFLDDEKTPFVWPGSNVTTMHGRPNTFITAVHLYDQHGECLAIANLSTPLKKNDDRDAVIKIKLEY